MEGGVVGKVVEDTADGERESRVFLASEMPAYDIAADAAGHFVADKAVEWARQGFLGFPLSYLLRENIEETTVGQIGVERDFPVVVHCKQRITQHLSGARGGFHLRTVALHALRHTATGLLSFIVFAVDGVLFIYLIGAVRLGKEGVVAFLKIHLCNEDGTDGKAEPQTKYFGNVVPASAGEIENG